MKWNEPFPKAIKSTDKKYDCASFPVQSTRGAYVYIVIIQYFVVFCKHYLKYKKKLKYHHTIDLMQ